MFYMNKVQLHGRIVKDPDIRATASNKKVASFTIAVDTYSGGERKAEFINCVAWQKTAELIEKHFFKGKEILVADGRLQTRSYEAQDGSKRYVTEVVVNEIEFCGSKSEGKASDNAFGGKEVNEDIPF
jgi:single-strand DNA-binding protein